MRQGSTSVIVRTYNEQRYLPELLERLRTQSDAGFEREIIVVDSGSTDNTLTIAAQFDCRIVHIEKSRFSFGRSLNVGCEAALGDILVFISGHCVPATDDWLRQLVGPIRDRLVEATYGRQLGGPESKFSEMQLFAQLYPATSSVPQTGFFSNNANAAVRRDIWSELRFDEQLTGLEDMDLAKRLVANDGKLGYVSEAPVFHYHHETWPLVKRRFEREAIALQHIMPEIHITVTDLIRYFTSAVMLDLRSLSRSGRGLGTLPEIVLFRLMQYWGSYRGNHDHRRLSQARKDHYFYPR